MEGVVEVDFLGCEVFLELCIGIVVMRGGGGERCGGSLCSFWVVILVLCENWG